MRDYCVFIPSPFLTWGLCSIDGVRIVLALMRSFANMFLLRHTVVPYILPRLQQAGYRLVTLAECLGRPAYS